jgi:hypothetical protein
MSFAYTVNLRGKAGALRADQLEAAVAAVERAPKNYSPSWRRALRDELTKRQSRHVVPELLQQIASLPNTTVRPYREGGGVQIIETRTNGVRQVGVWLDRPGTVGHLQEYLQTRQESRRD